MCIIPLVSVKCMGQFVEHPVPRRLDCQGLYIERGEFEFNSDSCLHKLVLGQLLTQSNLGDHEGRIPFQQE